MQKKKSDMLLLQQRFAGELLNNSLIVPTCLLEAYTQIGLNEYELIQLLKLQNAAAKQKLCFADFEKICSISAAEAEELQEKFLALNLLEADQAGNLCFDALYNALFDFWLFAQMKDVKDTAVESKPKSRSKSSALIRAFEKEFGRALSPIEIEKLMHWVSADKFPDNVIKEALQRAVMQGKVSFAYIDRILLNWKKSGFSDLDTINSKDKAKQFVRQETKKKQSVGAYDKLMR
ncbi:MAG: DnaD domain protein [Firmicutes bacterium]|nr:DnaD domain protein [Bacillota bacterium]